MKEPSRLQSNAIILGVTAYGLGTFLFLLPMNPIQAPQPDIHLGSVDGGSSYYVIRTEPGLMWEDFQPFGCNRRPNGPVEVNDTLTSCGGSLALFYRKLAVP